MPNINIDVKELVVDNAVEVTDNCVLIPLFVTKEGLKSQVFSSAKDFEAVYKAVDGKTDNNVAQFVEDGKNKFDTSFYEAAALLDAGLKVVICPIKKVEQGEAPTPFPSKGDLIAALITAINGTEEIDSIYEEFTSKNLFNIKFITSGAYYNCALDTTETTVGCCAKLAKIAEARKDAIALVEFQEGVAKESVLDLAQKVYIEKADYAAAFYPWCKIEGINEYMPANFAYLLAYANSVQSNPNWVAAAGVNRGQIPGFDAFKFELTEALVNKLQEITHDSNAKGIRVNGIMRVNNQPLVWGNRVCGIPEKNASYKQFLNVRLLVCDICKQIYNSAISVTFDPNDNVTWFRFTNLVNELLDNMKFGRGLEWYKWQRQESAKRATIKAQLILKPIEAVEDFEIGIVLTDSDADIL